MNERADHVLNEERPVSLFRPDHTALGDIQIWSYKDGVLIDYRVQTPGVPELLKWIRAHAEDEE